MILLLDAHALVWWLAGPGPLAEAAKRAIADPQNSVVVSAATVWEFEIKRAVGKVAFEADLPAEIDKAGISALPILLDDAAAAARLPAHHHDPFGRMLVAQAMRLDAVIVSRDRALAAYDVKVLTA